MRVGKGGLIAAGMLSAALFVPHAEANTTTSGVCGVSGDATAPATITYDPFSSTGLSEVTIPLVLRRNRIFSAVTDDVLLVLTAPSTAPPLEVSYQGYRVFYREGSTAGQLGSMDERNDPGAIYYDFGNRYASDLSAPLNLRVSVPPGTDLSAGEPIVFDILYICSGEGGMDDVRFPQRANAAVRINVNTVSALQAYYAGSVLDFGEIGGVSTATVLAAPDRYTTSASNALRVRSSGPFEVRVRSQNDFRLAYPGGNLADTSQTIRYSARFLGQDITSNASFVRRTCARAGIAGEAGVLPLRATLREGGAGKTPAPNYGDIVSITFTPVVSASSAVSCAGL